MHNPRPSGIDRTGRRIYEGSLPPPPPQRRPPQNYWSRGGGPSGSGASVVAAWMEARRNGIIEHGGVRDPRYIYADDVTVQGSSRGRKDGSQKRSGNNENSASPSSSRIDPLWFVTAIGCFIMILLVGILVVMLLMLFGDGKQSFSFPLLFGSKQPLNGSPTASEATEPPFYTSDPDFTSAMNVREDDFFVFLDDDSTGGKDDDQAYLEVAAINPAPSPRWYYPDMPVASRFKPPAFLARQGDTGSPSPAASPSPSPDGGGASPSPSPDGGDASPSPSPDAGDESPSPTPDPGDGSPAPTPDAGDASPTPTPEPTEGSDPGEPTPVVVPDDDRPPSPEPTPRRPTNVSPTIGIGTGAPRPERKRKKKKKGRSRSRNRDDDFNDDYDFTFKKKYRDTRDRDSKWKYLDDFF